ncbi:MAG: type II secretion system protein GspN [Deltaproteobacteria bacterium]|nr:type II secretion system protein GspN [Deltaproteobacteria bacterium]
MIQAFKGKNRYLYPVYIAVLLIFFLYVMFPDSILKGFLSSQAEDLFPDLSVRFEDAGFILPLGIKIRGLEVALKDSPHRPLYVSEKTSVRVSVPGLLFGGTKLTFSSRVNGGKLSGFYKEKDKDICSISIDIDDIALDGNPFILPETGKYIEGRLTGRISFAGSLSDFINGKGSIFLEAKKGRIKPSMPLFDIRDIGFENISLTGALVNMRFNLKDLSMKGGPINGKARGDVQLKSDIISSGLKFSVEITPTPEMKSEMPDIAMAIESSNMLKNGRLRLDIQGTLTNPIPVIR